MKRAVPRPVASYAPPPRELCPGLWVLDRQLVHFGSAILPTRTTILRLDSGSLVVISPPPLHSSAIDAIASIGDVADVVVPNSFHYLYAAEFMKSYPAARLLAAPGLVERVPELDFAVELGARPPAAWSGQLEYAVLGPVHGLSEVLLFHSPTSSLILTDLAFHMIHYPRTLDRLVWRLSGIPRDFGPGRTSRSLLLRDRAAASQSLARALEWPIRRIVMAHGDVVEHDAEARFRTAFAPHL